MATVGGIFLLFVGAFAPVSLGDYAAGSNHVLPTGGAARFDAIRNQVQQQTGADQTEQGADLIGWK
mgnify:CR=1 FL=1